MSSTIEYKVGVLVELGPERRCGKIVSIEYDGEGQIDFLVIEVVRYGKRWRYTTTENVKVIG